mgnify:CR=1 FL=1
MRSDPFLKARSPFLARLLWLILAARGVLPDLFAQAHWMPSAGPGIVEAGVPPFAVLGAESLGLDSGPTDIHLMPDGRILVVAGVQLAIGDGVRWEVFRSAPQNGALVGFKAAVDGEGNIYPGSPGKGARVIFGGNGLWHLDAGIPYPSRDPATVSVPQNVAEVGSDWLWYSSSGPVISWRPGQPARTVAQGDSLERIFQFEGDTYVSDRIDGKLSRLKKDGLETVFANGTFSAITAAQPFAKNLAVVGTYGLGLQLFDGKSVRPFQTGELLSRGTRINDLCTTVGGLFAAAVDNFGVVFFNREGQVVQVLDRSLDHRLSGVTGLVPSENGVIWGLLDGAVLRIGFPASISNFEPFIGTGITTVHPYRIDGDLWLLADGRTYRGDYDQSGRLTKMDVDTPEQLFVSNLSMIGSVAIAGTEQGAFYRAHSGWMSFAPDVNNLRILDPKPVNGRWLFSAQGEIGWLKPAGEGIAIVERISAPALGKVYNAVPDSRGFVWLELGAGRVGQIHFENGAPFFSTLTGDNGVPQTWAQIFAIDGTVRFNFAERIFRFDDASRRIVPDESFVQSLPSVMSIIGRPGKDGRGQLWVTAGGAVHRLEKEGGRWRERTPPLEVGFQPYYFTFEDGGIVWMHGLHRLARYDPAMPVAPAVPLRALISHLNLITSNRSVFNLDRELPPFDFSENSFVVHFLASGNKFAAPVMFEVKLEGSETEWISVGSSGSAAFNRLKEGKYILHVRPRSGATIGTEDALAFSILPPWYRTPAAYVAYGLSATGLVLLVAWLMTLLERRENSRLERVVAERTGELSRSNAQLAHQVEEIRVLTRAIVQSPIAVFITNPEGVIEFVNPRSCELTGCEAARLTGANLNEMRAPNIARQLLAEIAKTLSRGESWSGQLAYRRPDGRFVEVRSTISPILSPDGQTRHHLVLEEDITEWLADQQRNRRLQVQLTQAQKTESIGTLAGGIAHDFNNILTGILGYCELARLAADAQMDVRPDLQQIRVAGLRAKDLVMQILTFSRQSNTKLVPIELAGPVAEAMKLIRASTPSTIEIIEKLESGTILADATQIHQVMINLCTNAVHSMRDRRGRLEIAVRSLTVDAGLAAEIQNLKAGAYLRLTVSDNGHGMDQATLERIFDPFFTTKRQGEGTGLGLAIVQGVVVNHDGAIRVSSRPEEGTKFELYFPRTERRATLSTPAIPPATGEGQEILVVDDEPSVAEFAASRLKHFGYRPVLFRDPREALEAFNATPSRFAVVVTDLTMPHLTGLELINQVRSVRPLVPAVVLTGYGREEIREKIAELPCCMLLAKPFSGEELAHALSQVINQGRRGFA